MFQHIHNELSSTSQKNIYELCWFFYRGESSLTAKLENYSCSSIENCTVTWDIDNTKWDIPVIKINAILKQHVLLKANSSEYRSELKIGEKSIDGVPTRSMAIGKNKRIIEIPLYEFRNKVNSRNFSDSDFNYEDIHFAQNLQPSSSGINVNISYTITIELEYSTHCSSSPKWIIPLFIHAPDE